CQILVSKHIKGTVCSHFVTRYSVVLYQSSRGVEPRQVACEIRIPLCEHKGIDPRSDSRHSVRPQPRTAGLGPLVQLASQLPAPNHLQGPVRGDSIVRPSIILDQGRRGGEPSQVPCQTSLA